MLFRSPLTSSIWAAVAGSSTCQATAMRASRKRSEPSGTSWSAGTSVRAKRWRAWGYVYPFLELALGLAYLFHVAPTATHIATILLMGFSSLGVIAALSNRQRIVCACLGTVLKLPMSTITLVEDLGMVGMAAAMLLWGGHN